MSMFSTIVYTSGGCLFWHWFNAERGTSKSGPQCTRVFENNDEEMNVPSIYTWKNDLSFIIHPRI